MKRTMKKLFGLLSVVLVAVICFTQPVDAAKKEKRAKYFFYFIGYGMGINQVNGTEMYLAEKAGKIGVEPLNFTTFPVQYGMQCSVTADLLPVRNPETGSGFHFSTHLLLLCCTYTPFQEPSDLLHPQSGLSDLFR